MNKTTNLIEILLIFTFLGLECGFPGTPLNGSVSSSGMLHYPGETVTYGCQSGFVLFGPQVRNCTENGTWSLTVPECRKWHFFLSNGQARDTILWVQNVKRLWSLSHRRDWMKIDQFAIRFYYHFANSCRQQELAVQLLILCPPYHG